MRNNGYKRNGYFTIDESDDLEEDTDEFDDWRMLRAEKLSEETIQLAIESNQERRLKEEEDKKQKQIDMIYESANEIKKLKKIIESQRKDILELSGQIRDIDKWRNNNCFLTF